MSTNSLTNPLGHRHAQHESQANTKKARPVVQRSRKHPGVVSRMNVFECANHIIPPISGMQALTYKLSCFSLSFKLGQFGI